MIKSLMVVYFITWMFESHRVYLTCDRACLPMRAKGFDQPLFTLILKENSLRTGIFSD